MSITVAKHFRVKSKLSTPLINHKLLTNLLVLYLICIHNQILASHFKAAQLVIGITLNIINTALSFPL